MVTAAADACGGARGRRTGLQGNHTGFCQNTYGMCLVEQHLRSRRRAKTQVNGPAVS